MGIAAVRPAPMFSDNQQLRGRGADKKRSKEERELANSQHGGDVSELERARLVEEILNLEYWDKPIYDSMRNFAAQPELYGGFVKASALAENRRVQEINARRSELLQATTLGLRSHLDALRAQQKANQQAAAQAAEERRRTKAEAAERKRFYNTPGLQVDWEYWARLEYWTFDEAVALTLRRDPKVVTHKAVLKEIASTKDYFGPPMSQFLQDYQRLRGIAERASVMTAKTGLRPREVLRWAKTSSGFEPPDELVRAVDRLQPAIPPTPSSTPITAAPHVARPADAPVAIRNTTVPMRRDILAPAVEEAQRRCARPLDAAAVWAALVVLADERFPPLIGCTEDGVQYHRDGEAGIFTRDALSKRLKRARERPDGPPQ